MRACALVCAAALLALAACNDRQKVVATAPAAASVASVAASSAPVADHAIAPPGQADRLPPPDVPPVTRDGVKYEQAEDGRKAGLMQEHGVLAAFDETSGKLLWSLAVYATDVDPKQEADAQWVFFKSMAFDADGRLRIVNEAGKAFLVDVKRRIVVPG